MHATKGSDQMDIHIRHRKVRKYMDRLAAKGQEPREVARAGLYADKFGLGAFIAKGGGHIRFAKPTCRDGWDCINPDHQTLEAF